MPVLPTPNETARAHSQQLLNLLHAEIASAGGYVSFARFMEFALYAPGLGYYSAGSHKLGKQGDFITAPEISPLFAQCIARQCQPILAAIANSDILEIGAGSGQLACDLLQEMARLDALPRRYFILEISADLRARQQALLQETCPALLTRIEWLDTLPADGFRGVILANEVMDAMPVHIFQLDKNRVKERCVNIENDRLTWHLAEPTTPVLSKEVAALHAAHHFTPGYLSEVNLMVTPWLKSLGATLQQGIILLFDYGYSRHEYYHPERNSGTLMCFYQHHRHTNPFAYVGLQDMTAHVDFTRVAESALDADLSVAGYTTQAAFLLACGITEFAAHAKDAVQQYELSQAIKMLTLPSQMGEIVKVMALSKKLDIPLLGFSWLDRRKDLS